MSIFNKLRGKARNLFLYVAGTFRHPSAGIHILGGHKATPYEGCGSKEDMKRFDDLLSKLEKYCNLVRFEDALDLIRKGGVSNKPIVAFSFDDGFEDCYYSIAPVLEKHGINGMFFINPNAADASQNGDENYIRHFAEVSTVSSGKRPMSWTQINELIERGHLIGAHTLDHYMINTDDNGELERQIKNCRPAIESKVSLVCDSFAWPYGQMSHINDSALAIATENYTNVFSQTDYKHYFSCNGKVINRRHFEPFWKWQHVFYFLSFKKK